MAAGQDTPSPPTARPIVTRRRRDIAAAVLMVAGTAGTVTAAWLYAPLAGLAVMSLLCLIAGIFAGME